MKVSRENPKTPPPQVLSEENASSPPPTQVQEQQASSPLPTRVLEQQASSPLPTQVQEQQASSPLPTQVQEQRDSHAQPPTSPSNSPAASSPNGSSPLSQPPSPSNSPAATSPNGSSPLSHSSSSSHSSSTTRSQSSSPASPTSLNSSATSSSSNSPNLANDNSEKPMHSPKQAPTDRPTQQLQQLIWDHIKPTTSQDKEDPRQAGNNQKKSARNHGYDDRDSIDYAVNTQNNGNSQQLQQQWRRKTYLGEPGDRNPSQERNNSSSNQRIKPSGDWGSSTQESGTLNHGQDRNYKQERNSSQDGKLNNSRWESDPEWDRRQSNRNRNWEDSRQQYNDRQNWDSSESRNWGDNHTRPNQAQNQQSNQYHQQQNFKQNYQEQRAQFHERQHTQERHRNYQHNSSPEDAPQHQSRQQQHYQPRQQQLHSQQQPQHTQQQQQQPQSQQQQPQHTQQRQSVQFQQHQTQQTPHQPQLQSQHLHLNQNQNQSQYQNQYQSQHQHQNQTQIQNHNRNQTQNQQPKPQQPYQQSAHNQTVWNQPSPQQPLWNSPAPAGERRSNDMTNNAPTQNKSAPDANPSRQQPKVQLNSTPPSVPQPTPQPTPPPSTKVQLNSTPPSVPQPTPPPSTSPHIPPRDQNIRSSNPQELPITAHRESILDAVRNHQVVIISGATGSGKTTQVPKYILEESRRNSTYCNIICTQPRRIAAISIAKRVAEELGEDVGHTVGYQIGMDKQTSDSETKLLFVTTGVILKKLVNSRSLEQYSHVILDEVHERDLDTDFALVVIKQLLSSHPAVRLILMSATFNCELFVNYFPLEKSASKVRYTLAKGIKLLEDANMARNKPEYTAAPLLSVGGRCYPVQEIYLDDIVEMLSQRNLRAPAPNLDCFERDERQPIVDSNSLLLAVHLVLQLQGGLVSNHFDNAPKEDNAVLVFLPGLGEIQEMRDLFSQFDVSSLWIVPLHSSVTSEEQAQAFKRAPTGVRKVILATNIAESSVTVKDIRYVIDLGFVKEIFFDPQTNLESLKLQYASKASAMQRQGRAGRVGPGFVFRLYTRDFYEAVMPDYSPSEMLRCPLESLVLHIKVMNEDVQLLDRALQPPDLKFLNQALVNLRNAGGLDSRDNITYLGMLYSALPLDIKLSRLLLIGHIFGLSDEIIDIAANVSLRGIFTRSFNQPFMSFARKLDWSQDSESDSITASIAINAYRGMKFTNQRAAREYCRNNFLHYNTIQELEDLRRELNGRLRSQITFHNPETLNADEKKILTKAIIFGAFYPNYYVGDYADKREFQNLTSDSWNRVSVDPFRSIVVAGLSSEVTEERVTELLKPCGKVSQVRFQMGNKAYVEFAANNDPKKAVILALKMGSMKKLILNSHNTPVFQDSAARFNSGKMGREDDSEETNAGDGPEVHLPPMIPASWGLKVLPIPIHAYRLNFEAQNYQAVNIDSQSVNSVAVEHSANKHNNEETSFSAESHRYLAAAFVNSGGNWCEKQLLRETTLLPPIPLIGPILAMIFCPVREMHLWPNRRRTHYLGVTMHEGQLEFSFTHIFLQKDLDDINALRQHISLALTKNGIQQDHSWDIRSKLWDLITRDRKPIRVRRRPVREDTIRRAFDGEHLLLMPIVPVVKLEPCRAEDAYDSDEEEKAMKRKLADEIRYRFIHTEAAQKAVICDTCQDVVATLSSLENNPEYPNTFRLLRPFGMAFVIPDDPDSFGCRNLHPIGRCLSSVYYLDADSHVLIQVPDEAPLPWTEENWKDNFAAVGGPTLPITPELPITRELLYCSICNHQAHDKRGFNHHINSSSHREEEKYYVISGSR